MPGETAPLRAQALERLGKLVAAEEAYRAAVKENPKDVKSLVGLGSFHLRRGEFAEAEKIYKQAKTTQPNNSDVQLGLAASALCAVITLPILSARDAGTGSDSTEIINLIVGNTAACALFAAETASNTPFPDAPEAW